MGAKKTDINDFLPKKRKTGIVQAQIDVDVRSAIKKEITRLDCSWSEFLEAVLKKYMTDNNLK